MDGGDLDPVLRGKKCVTQHLFTVHNVNLCERALFRSVSREVSENCRMSGIHSRAHHLFDMLEMGSECVGPTSFRVVQHPSARYSASLLESDAG